MTTIGPLTTPEDLARTLPDTAGWVDIRGLLLSGCCELYGDAGDDREGGHAARSTRTPLAAALGRPAPATLRRALAGGGADLRLLARPEDAAAVAAALAEVQPGWTATGAILHRLPPGAELVSPTELAEPAGHLRLLGPEDHPLVDQLPAGLREEIALALTFTPTAAALVGNHIAAVCYAPLETETLWDVSIDTVPEHRRRGLAAHAVAFLAGVMKERGKRPVWGAEETNTASLALAAKLGFEPVDRLAVFAPPDAG